VEAQKRSEDRLRVLRQQKNHSQNFANLKSLTGGASTSSNKNPYFNQTHRLESNGGSYLTIAEKLYEEGIQRVKQLKA
jgi:hypothetical protein